MLGALLTLCWNSSAVQEYNVGKCEQIEWLSPTKAVLVKSIPYGSELYEFEYPSGKQKRISGWWQKSSGGFELIASPDGKALLFKELRWFPSKGDAGLFGTVSRAPKYEKRSAPLSHVNTLAVWAYDGSSWYEIPSRIGPGVSQVVRHSATKIAKFPERWGPFGTTVHLTGTLPASMTPRMSLLILKEWLGLGPIVKTLTVLEVYASRAGRRYKGHTIPMPSQAHLWQSRTTFLRFDRKGKRIACLIKRHAYNLQEGWDVNELLGAPMEVWIATLDGTGLRKVADIPVRFTPHEKDNGHPEDLDWLPDGSALSYLQREKLVVLRL